MKKSGLIPGTVIVLFGLLLLGGGWLIPFEYESFSILYKFGTAKKFLRSGKIAGITVALLVFYQVLLASRFKVLERIYSRKWLLRLHRGNGMVLAAVALVHPLLILASENFTFYTFDRKYYPEYIGIGLLLLLLAVSLTAVLKDFFKFTYKKWLLWHRIGATLVLLVMPAHVLYVSETFKSGLPRQAALVIFSLNLLLIARIWLLKLLK